MFEIAHPAKGRLWIMPCPDGAELQRDTAMYCEGGVDHVVSMLTVDEARSLGLASEGEACEKAGLSFDQHPITDFGLPDMADFHALVMRIKGLLQDGEGVAVHCRAGIGRSGMVTTGVLVALGSGPEEAIEKVSHARGVSVPDTVEQGRFVEAFSRNHELRN